MTKPVHPVSLYTWGCGLFAAVGSLLYGIDSGIISTTISQPSFITYFAPLTPSIKGAIVSIFGAGSFFGLIFAGWAADYWGRKKTIQFASVFALIAGIIQAAATNVGMLIAGRIIGGFAVGIMNMTIPIYNSEIAPPSKRGMITGLHAQFVGIGFAVANWVGFGCSYSTSDFQWRFPLAFQCLPALIVLIGTFWLPYSPRWLLENERDEEAYTVLKRLHGDIGNDESFLQAEFAQMRDQIRFEKSITVSSTKELFAKPNNRKRIVLAILIQVFTQLSGINVINYYQTDLYKGLGITGHTVTLLASIYGMVGPIANVICLYFVDSWGRRKTLWITGIIMAIDISLVMAMTASFTGTSNAVGKGFGVAFIFCFSIIYSLGYNSIHYIYVPEIMTMAIRAQGSSISMCCNVLVNIIFNQVSPIAFASVGWKYYSLFICTNVLGAVVVFMFFPETKGKSLEEIAAIFGDEVITPDLASAREKILAQDEEREEHVGYQDANLTTDKTK
ncbi:hypothetical protein V491_00113 [Pseudogymnoascus sp. VKM F-3775]|nr:hypothetical protein V491_00113 [Pseudogymnoascus sp. VKM F-3775]